MGVMCDKRGLPSLLVKIGVSEEYNLLVVREDQAEGSLNSEWVFRIIVAEIHSSRLGTQHGVASQLVIPNTQGFR